jgi:hypothetical protein
MGEFSGLNESKENAVRADLQSMIYITRIPLTVFSFDSSSLFVNYNSSEGITTGGA